jgi:hypothetical protein
MSYRQKQKKPQRRVPSGLKTKKPRMDMLESIRGNWCYKKLMRRMNASKAEKEASEKKVSVIEIEHG